MFFSQEKDNEDDLELSLYCVTCGAELNQKGALRHMEKCFSKVCCMHTLQFYVLAVLNCLLLLKHYLDFIVSLILNPTSEISTDLLVVWGSDFLWVDLQDENRGELHVLWLLQHSTEGLLQAAQSPVSRAHQRAQGNILHLMVKLQVFATWFCVMNTWADQQSNIK